MVYRWVDGTRLTDYSWSWRAWEQRTDTAEFADALTAIVDAQHVDVDALAFAVENFLLDEAIALGVVKKSIIRPASNPNK